eukprot:3746926-Amphidinium_carterae.1
MFAPMPFDKQYERASKQRKANRISPEKNLCQELPGRTDSASPNSIEVQEQPVFQLPAAKAPSFKPQSSPSQAQPVRVRPAGPGFRLSQAMSHTQACRGSIGLYLSYLQQNQENIEEIFFGWFAKIVPLCFRLHQGSSRPPHKQKRAVRCEAQTQTYKNVKVTLSRVRAYSRLAWGVQNVPCEVQD